MSYLILHFNGAKETVQKKMMEQDIQNSLEHIDEIMSGNLPRPSFKELLVDMGWKRESFSILEGRCYYYQGYKNGIAMDGNFSSYEYLLDGLFRLQVGFDKGKIEGGILLLTNQAGEKIPYGSTKKYVENEIPLLHPTISIPVAVVLFDLPGARIHMPGEKGEQVMTPGES